MGYVLGLGSCGLCDLTFAFNPERVPCFPLNRTKAPAMSVHRFDKEASKEPVCEPCFDAINRFRVENGLEPHTALRGAWDESEE